MDGIQEAWLTGLSRRLAERRAGDLYRELRANFTGAGAEIELADGAGVDF